MLELDCQLTADNQVVVSHDQNLMRVCGLDIDISKTPYSKLPLLRNEISVDFDLGNVLLVHSVTFLVTLKGDNIHMRFWMLVFSFLF